MSAPTPANAAHLPLVKLLLLERLDLLEQLARSADGRTQRRVGARAVVGRDAAAAKGISEHLQ